MCNLKVKVVLCAIFKAALQGQSELQALCKQQHLKIHSQVVKHAERYVPLRYLSAETKPVDLVQTNGICVCAITKIQTQDP